MIDLLYLVAVILVIGWAAGFLLFMPVIFMHLLLLMTCCTVGDYAREELYHEQYFSGAYI